MLCAWKSFSGDIVLQSGDCALSDWDLSFFSPFTKTGNKSVLKIKVSLSERDHFGGAQASGIHELEYCEIAQTLVSGQVWCGEELLYL